MFKRLPDLRYFQCIGIFDGRKSWFPGLRWSIDIMQNVRGTQGRWLTRSASRLGHSVTCVYHPILGENSIPLPFLWLQSTSMVEIFHPILVLMCDVVFVSSRYSCVLTVHVNIEPINRNVGMETTFLLWCCFVCSTSVRIANYMCMTKRTAK